MDKITLQAVLSLIAQKSPDISSRLFEVFECFSSLCFLCSYDLYFENQFYFLGAKLR